MGSYSLDQETKIGVAGYDDDVSSMVSLDDECDDVFEEHDSSSSNHSHVLGDMSDLHQQLPYKRFGLSKHYQGKSQSFTCLSKVMCVEDLAKPENPNNKKLKSCKSYVGFSRGVPSLTRRASSSNLFTRKIYSGTSSSSQSNSSCRLSTCSSSISS